MKNPREPKESEHTHRQMGIHAEHCTLGGEIAPTAPAAPSGFVLFFFFNSLRFLMSVSTAVRGDAAEMPDEAGNCCPHD